MAALATGARVHHIAQRDAVAKWNADHQGRDLPVVIGTVTGHRDSYSPHGTGSIADAVDVQWDGDPATDTYQPADLALAS
jgi:hypothetical protein